TLGIGSYKPQVGAGESAKVREHGREVAVVHPKPGCQRGKVLITGGGRNPAASAGVVGAIDGQSGEHAIGLLAVNRAAHDQVMAAPAVVAALTVPRERPAKITAREGGDALREARITVEHTDLVHGALEGIQALAELGEQVGMRAIKNGAAGGLIGLFAVQVVGADLAEKDLALHAKAAADGGPVTGFNEAGDHLELRAKRGVEFGAAGRRGDLESP